MSTNRCTDLVTELIRLEKSVDSGKDYGFQQSIWKEARTEIERLRAELAAMTNSRDAYSEALLEEARRHGGR